MPPLGYFAALLSTLFRLAAFIFLRIIPTRLVKPVLPSLFFSYVLFSWLATPKDPSSLQPNTVPKQTATTSKDELQSEPGGVTDDKIQPGVENHSDAHNAPRSSAQHRVSPFYELLALIFSLPSKLRPVRLFNLYLNLALFIAALDFVVTPFIDSASDVVFTRVGAVLPDSAKVTVRFPQLNTTEHLIRVLYREVGDDGSWREGPALNLTSDDDWVGTTIINNLWPNTRYEYILAGLNGTLLHYPSSPIPFKTFPDPRLPGGSQFRFLATSCITPNHPYNGPHHRNTIRGFDFMAEYLFPDADMNVTADADDTHAVQNWTHLAAPPSAEFLVFLGDFIYADVPIYIGDDREAYRRLYRRNYNSPSFRKIYERLPIYHAYDDHEFVNNYAGASNDSAPYPSASNAYSLYNSGSNYESSTAGQHYYEFQYGDTAFFVMDTRRHRSSVDTEIQSRTMLGDTQLAALHNWLTRVNETSTFKFVVSSVPFTSLWTHDAVYDSWAGFPTEKSTLLSAFHSIPNLFVLSGDRHEFAAIEFNAESPHKVHEFSTSPLNMFYIPFIHTLRSESEEGVQAGISYHQATNATNMTYGNATEAHGDANFVPTERVIKYIPHGNSKWSTFEIDTRNPEKPELKVEVVIDGKPTYHWSYVGKPLALKTSSALGLFVQGGIQEIFTRFGLNPTKWF